MNMLIRGLLAAEKFVRGTKAVPEQVNTALFLEYRLPLGCLVHLTPVFEAVKRFRPEIAVAVATAGLGLQVLRHNPFVDHLIDAPDPTLELRRAVSRLREELNRRNIRPDCVLTGASDQRTKIALLGLLGSSGWRGGFTVNPALYHRPLKYDAGLSLIRNNLRLAELIGCSADSKPPRVFFSKADAEAAIAMLQAANPEGRHVLAMVTQTSGGQSIGWHTERLVEVIRNAAVERGFGVVYLGTAGEAAAIEELRQAAGGLGTSIAGKTTVNQLAAVLALSDFSVALDTGPMHVARAAATPMVVLAPSWQKPLEWLPLAVDNVRILRGEDRIGIPPGYRLDEISAGAVIAALDELVQVYPPSETAREARLQAGMSEVDHLETG